MRIRRLVPASMAAIMVGAVALTACGGDGGGDPASDEEYVRSICSTISDAQAELTELTTEASSEEELLEGLAETLSAAADRLADVTPPDDVAEGHDQVVEAFRQTADSLEEGNLDALDQLDPGEIENDPAAEERLRTVADGVDECSGLGLFN